MHSISRVGVDVILKQKICQDTFHHAKQYSNSKKL